MMLIKKILVCFLAGAGAGIGTGFAGMSAAAIIGPLLTTFLGMLGTLAVIRSKEGGCFIQPPSNLYFFYQRFEHCQIRFVSY